MEETAGCREACLAAAIIAGETTGGQINICITMIHYLHLTPSSMCYSRNCMYSWSIKICAIANYTDSSMVSSSDRSAVLLMIRQVYMWFLQDQCSVPRPERIPSPSESSLFYHMNIPLPHFSTLGPRFPTTPYVTQLTRSILPSESHGRVPWLVRRAPLVELKQPSHQPSPRPFRRRPVFCDLDSVSFTLSQTRKCWKISLVVEQLTVPGLAPAVSSAEFDCGVTSWRVIVNEASFLVIGMHKFIWDKSGRTGS